MKLNIEKLPTVQIIIKLFNSDWKNNSTFNKVCIDLTKL